MKKLLLFLSLCFVSFAQAQYTAIPDKNFENRLIYLKYDDVQDGKVLTANINTVTDLDVSNSSITDLTGIQEFIALKSLVCSDNQLTSLNVTNNTALTNLNCGSNKLTNLDVSQNTALTELRCFYNQLTSIDLSKNIALTYLNCSANQMTTLDMSHNTALTFLGCSENPLTKLDVSHNTALKELYCTNNQLSSLNLNYNTLLTKLDCSENKLTTLDASQNTKLIQFGCDKNQLSSLFISQNIVLETIDCSSNQLTTLDVRNNKALYYLNCNENKITSLDLGNNQDLKTLYCSKNKLTSLDLSYNTELTDLFCDSNQLTSLDVWGNTELGRIVCFDNDLSTLDVSKNSMLNSLVLGGMKNLITLFAKNGNSQLKLENWVAFSIDLPALKYACLDEFNFDQLRNLVGQAEINSYCSFTPGGSFYTLQGTSKLDEGDNGCDAQDGFFPNLKFNITNGTVSGSTISDKTGNYKISLQEGTYTVTPVLENSTYFSVSPSSFNVSFPTQTSPLSQDICITPNGVHHDVEAVLMPKRNAVPGFDANYKLLIKNKGNQTESGQITIAFDDMVMDFVSASTTPLKVENGLLTFEFTALQPFESKSIDLIFKMNQPTDIPALNAGDVLTFVASISGNTPEETPLDNISTIKQTVRNSFDPNDKTCLEGNTVTPELVGQYVHYVVRFENTGTLAAKNIVVKDIIDTAKFDVNSLIVTNSSHSCVTKISETNKVEFIFENINLPFDNATNDGYIAFKIKTLPSLVVGDTFSNTADIFFDYNSPITTNEAKTTVQVLSTSDFAFENYFSLYPNPAKNNLTLNSKNSIEIKNINVFNTLGQLVLSIPNAQTVSNFDVSRLNTGTYFVKIVTNKGTSTTKFIKE